MAYTPRYYQGRPNQSGHAKTDSDYLKDPRKVPTAILLPSLSPAEAAELTYVMVNAVNNAWYIVTDLFRFYGSEVIHPFTMQQVIDAR